MKEKSKRPTKVPPEEYEIWHDSIGVMLFLQPERCKGCNE